LRLNLKDDGKGFEPSDEPTNPSGFGGNGLVNMKRRTKNSGGAFIVDSQIGRGTEITIKLPLHEKSWT